MANGQCPEASQKVKFIVRNAYKIRAIGIVEPIIADIPFRRILLTIHDQYFLWNTITDTLWKITDPLDEPPSLESIFVVLGRDAIHELTVSLVETF